MKTKKLELRLSKNEILTVISLAVLFFTMFINWTIYAWIISLVVMIAVGVWYFWK